MADKKKPSGYVISNAVRAQRQLPGAPDRTRLSEILVKSPQWKKNVLGRADPVGIDETAPGAAVAADPEQLKASLMELIEQHWRELVSSAYCNSRQDLPHSSRNLPAENDDIGNQEAEQQARTQARQARELQRLQQRVMALEAENALLVTRYEDEVNTRRSELLELQKAFEQFQAESDQLLSELDQQNEALRINDSD